MTRHQMWFFFFFFYIWMAVRHSITFLLLPTWYTNFLFIEWARNLCIKLMIIKKLSNVVSPQ